MTAKRTSNSHRHIRVVSLLTDFGLSDPYVAEMKAVILSICPRVSLVDITHEVEKYDIRMGAYILARSAEFFPKGTIHVAVVDPSVGTERKPIIIDTEGAVFIGPDNGVLTLAADRLGIKHVYEIENPEYTLPKISKTFHGRDIFAAVAGHIAAGVNLTAFGKEVFEYEKPSFTRPNVISGKIVGEIVHIDSFGNLTTNIDAALFRMKDIAFNREVRIILGSVSPFRARFLETYSKASLRKILVTIGSGGFIEISANQANASRMLKAKRGMKIKILF